MKRSRILVLGLAVVAAGGAYLLMSAPRPEPAPIAALPAPAPTPIPTDQILVASKDIPIGTVVGDADIGWQSWPKSSLAPGMILKSTEPKALDDIKGSIVRASFYAGEPVHREKLIKGSGSGFVSAMLPSGMRAVAINIDSQGANSAGGFILPGDRVDVVRTYQADKSGQSGNNFTTETLLRNVKVLAIGQNLQDKNGQSVVVGSNATLELDPVQSEKVILAQRVGQLSLTLRSIVDANKTAEPAETKPDQDLTVVRYGYSDGAMR